MAIKAAIKEEKETEINLDENLNLESIDKVLSCKEFKLLNVELKDDRKFEVKFMADTIGGKLVLNLSIYQDKTQMENTFQAIGDIVFAKIVPDQKRDTLSIIGIHRKDKNNKAKEPGTYFIFKTKNTKAQGYISTSSEILKEDLPELFQTLFQQLEIFTWDEIERYKEDPQLSLFDGPTDSQEEESA